MQHTTTCYVNTTYTYLQRSQWKSYHIIRTVRYGNADRHSAKKYFFGVGKTVAAAGTTTTTTTDMCGTMKRMVRRQI